MTDVEDVAIREAIALDTRELRHRAERLEDFAIAAIHVIAGLGGLEAVQELPEADVYFRTYGKLLINKDLDPARLNREVVCT